MQHGFPYWQITPHLPQWEMDQGAHPCWPDVLSASQQSVICSHLRALGHPKKTSVSGPAVGPANCGQSGSTNLFFTSLFLFGRKILSIFGEKKSFAKWIINKFKLHYSVQQFECALWYSNIEYC